MSKSFIVLSGLLLVILLVCYFRCYCNYLQATKIVLFLLLYCLLKVFPQSLILASNSPGVPALFWHVSTEALGTAIFSSSSQIFLDFLFLVEFILLCLPVWCGIVALKANTVTWNFLQVAILNTPFLSDTTVGPSPPNSTEAWVSDELVAGKTPHWDHPELTIQTQIPDDVPTIIDRATWCPKAQHTSIPFHQG